MNVNIIGDLLLFGLSLVVQLLCINYSSQDLTTRRICLNPFCLNFIWLCTFFNKVVHVDHGLQLLVYKMVLTNKICCSTMFFRFFGCLRTCLTSTYTTRKSCINMFLQLFFSCKQYLQLKFP
jgi:hypothetical protein